MPFRTQRRQLANKRTVCKVCTEKKTNNTNKQYVKYTMLCFMTASLYSSILCGWHGEKKKKKKGGSKNPLPT